MTEQLKLIGKLSEDMLQRYRQMVQEMIDFSDETDAEIAIRTPETVAAWKEKHGARNRQLGQARGAFMQELRELYGVDDTFTIDDETGEVFLVPL
ncbi:hypothetical protein [Paenibacillus xylanexedens]|uniref:hypothetical protein n=1 Tax=Paenibacillus xylanexedens TaxID=528191 RepID=UPI0011A1EE46|nr:hypothetical protein [Paenibacillus xylanexedens]